MPPKMILGIRPPSPMKTRQRNKDQHPGVADAPKSRRSHAEMEALRLETAQKKKITEEEKQKALKHVAEVEDTLRNEDIGREVTRRAATSAKEKAMKSAGTLQILDISTYV
jgi:hypothetical protein